MKCKHLGEKTEDTSELNDRSPLILVREQRTKANSTRQALQSWCVKTTTGIAQIDKISPWCPRKCHSPRAPHCAGGQAGRKEIRVFHRDTNHFRIFAILRNAGNGQFDRDRLAIMVKYIGMGEKG
ncbi:hypothetical protein TNCV_2240771 [Trichonephila clavipes]|nr:hypothetical protein TNCV_2240771 [Trichonephila clavipes]